jgi:hypothetical protein
MKDVFISYAHEDGDWVGQLARQLEAEGLNAFLDKWDIGPGDTLVHELDEAVRTSMNAIQILSPVSVTKPWVRQEYAALLSASVERGMRFIPVLYAAPGPQQHIEVPPFAATRMWMDFWGVTGEAHDRKVTELARAIRGEKPERS